MINLERIWLTWLLLQGYLIDKAFLLITIMWNTPKQDLGHTTLHWQHKYTFQVKCLVLVKSDIA